jgi:hypothetical protein
MSLCPDQDWAILSSTAFSLAALPREPRPPPPRWPAARKMALRGREPAASLYLVKALKSFARLAGTILPPLSHASLLSSRAW